MPDYVDFKLYAERASWQVGRSLPLVASDETDMLAEILRDSGSDTVVMADCRGGAELQRFDMALSVAEARLALAEGRTKVIASACDSPAGFFMLGTFAGKSGRLAGLTWDRAAFASEMRCDPSSETAEMARQHVVIAGRAAGVLVYDCGDASGDADLTFIGQSRALGFDGLASRLNLMA